MQTILSSFRKTTRRTHGGGFFVSFFLIGCGVLLWALPMGGCSDDDSHTPNVDAAVDGGDATTDDDGDVDGDTPVQEDCEGVTFDPCTPRQGTNGAVLLKGTVVTPDTVICNGEVLFSRDSEVIECIGEDCSGETLAAEATIICGDVIMPGMIDAHNHMTYNTVPMWRHDGVLYEHRDEWRNDNDFNAYDVRLNGNIPDRYSEFRLLMAGTTGVHKSSFREATFTGVRNLDRGPEANSLGLPGDAVEECVFPLTGSCDDKPDYNNLDPDLRSYLVHLCEGINQKAYDEYQELVDDGQLGDKTVVIHGISLDAEQLAEIASVGARFVWSPQTNIDLYGQTADVSAVWNMGIPVALAPDWTISGCMNLIAEIKCADHLNTKYYNNHFSARQLVSMITSGAATVMGLDDLLGYLRVGHFADLVMVTGDREHPFEAIVQMRSADVRAVFISGVAFYGDRDALNSDIEYNEFCEDISVCSTEKRICIKQESGTPSQPLDSSDWAQFSYQDYIDYLQDELDILMAQNNPPPQHEYLYELLPLFDCEPYFACDMGNAYVPGEPTATDNDGDGIENANDNCPDVFNPKQGDLDEDGLGTACDPCPYAEDPTNCPKPDPTDRDGDGIPNTDDNCPRQSNPDQTDGDDDGIGDVCDACPDYANPNNAPCPGTIYDIRTGVFGPGDPVQVSGNLVNGVATDVGFFMQVPTDHPDYDGEDYSGIFVYTGSSGPAVSIGDKVTVSGMVDDYYGQIQISNVTDVTVESQGNPAPTPISVTPSEIGTGGSRAVQLEGVVCAVTDLNVTEVEMNYFEFKVNDTLWINDYMYQVTPFPSVGDHFNSITGIVQYHFSNHKLAPRDADDVVTGPPALDALSPNLSFAYESQTAVPIPTLEVHLTGPALTDTDVSLSSSDPNVATVPTAVTVPQGQQSTTVQVTGVSAAVNPVTITAELDSVQQTAQVRVLDGTETPQIVSLEPANLSLGVNSLGTLTATLDIPARTGGETLNVSLTPGIYASAPATVNVAAGEMTADIEITALTDPGTESVEVSLGASSETATVEVLDSALTGMILTQVFYDHSSTDGGYEWIQIYNGTASAVDLSGYSLGWGGTDYTSSTLQLQGNIPAFSCFIVGGPTADAENGNPTFDQAVDLDSDLQNGGSDADGIALFDVDAASITTSTVPIDAVIYGASTNGNDLMDETGNPGAVDVGDANAGEALLRDSETTWTIIGTPDPGNCPAF
jgi:cytosine/adenosine deaminase-related metal-dependent hydrolase